MASQGHSALLVEAPIRGLQQSASVMTLHLLGSWQLGCQRDDSRLLEVFENRFAEITFPELIIQTEILPIGFFQSRVRRITEQNVRKENGGYLLEVTIP